MTNTLMCHSPEDTGDGTLQAASPETDLLAPAEPDFVDVEKNIVALGFFTPSSSRIITDKKKTISSIRYLNGERVETTSTILPSAYFGLPVTADQDKYFALQKIIQNHRRRTGAVPDPVGFTSAELLRILGVRKNGKNYDDIVEWMQRMTATTISAKVYLAGRKAWVEDTFHVFDRAVMKGMEMADGKIADMNYVWLAPWQRENIAANFQIPIDFDAYCRLRNHIAKALVPLLQIWLYTSMRAGRFEKSYTDLCQLLNIRRYEHLSKIRGVLAPSLDELANAGYLASWSVEPRTKVEDFKVCVTHGPKFFADRETRSYGERTVAAVSGLVEELRRRGVSESVARQLLASIPDDQPVSDQLEWGDYLIQTSRAGTFRNPAGFYVYLLRNGIVPPSTFETSAVRAARVERETTRSSAVLLRLEMQAAYSEYRNRELEEAKRLDFPGERLAERLRELKNEIREATPEADTWLAVRLEEVALQKLNAEIVKRLPLLTFDEFAQRQHRQTALFEPQRP